MSNKHNTSNLGERLEQGVILARKRMLHEKALHDRDVIISDDNGNIVHIPAKEIIATHAEYQ